MVKCLRPRSSRSSQFFSMGLNLGATRVPPVVHNRILDSQTRLICPVERSRSTTIMLLLLLFSDFVLELEMVRRASD